MSLAAQGEHSSTGGSCGRLKGWRQTPQNGLYWGKSLFKIATMPCDGPLSEMLSFGNMTCFGNVSEPQNALGNAACFLLILARFIETWDGDSSTALKLGQDAGFYWVLNEMKAVEIPTGFNTRRKLKWHGNKHSFQCWTCSVGYFWSWWNNKFNNWQTFALKTAGREPTRVPGWPGQGQKASRQECHRVCTGGETGKLLSLVLGLFCDKQWMLFGIIRIQCKDPY